jgi:hypothetical protein
VSGSRGSVPAVITHRWNLMIVRVGSGVVVSIGVV